MNRTKMLKLVFNLVLAPFSDSQWTKIVLALFHIQSNLYKAAFC